MPAGLLVGLPWCGIMIASKRRPRTATTASRPGEADRRSAGSPAGRIRFPAGCCRRFPIAPCLAAADEERGRRLVAGDKPIAERVSRSGTPPSDRLAQNSQRPRVAIEHDRRNVDRPHRESLQQFGHGVEMIGVVVRDNDGVDVRQSSRPEVFRHLAGAELRRAEPPGVGNDTRPSGNSTTTPQPWPTETKVQSSCPLGTACKPRDAETDAAPCREAASTASESPERAPATEREAASPR